MKKAILISGGMHFALAGAWVVQEGMQIESQPKLTSSALEVTGVYKSGELPRKISKASTPRIKNLRPGPSVSKSINEAGVTQEALSETPIQPEYPRLSRRMGEEGVVILEAEITSQGSAQQVLVLQSSGFFRLDEAAKKAVYQAKFSPIASKKRLRFRFELQTRI